jgi:hypothetical protein
MQRRRPMGMGRPCRGRGRSLYGQLCISRLLGLRPEWKAGDCDNGSSAHLGDPSAKTARGHSTGIALPKPSRTRYLPSEREVAADHGKVRQGVVWMRPAGQLGEFSRYLRPADNIPASVWAGVLGSGSEAFMPAPSVSPSASANRTTSSNKPCLASRSALVVATSRYVVSSI